MPALQKKTKSNCRRKILRTKTSLREKFAKKETKKKATKLSFLRENSRNFPASKQPDENGFSNVKKLPLQREACAPFSFPFLKRISRKFRKYSASTKISQIWEKRPRQEISSRFPFPFWREIHRNFKDLSRMAQKSAKIWSVFFSSKLQRQTAAKEKYP